MAKPRYTAPRPVVASCQDCGVAVTDRATHTRFHSILSAQAWALGVLKSHAPAGVRKRIDSKRFDSWSADALAEVIAEGTANIPNRLEAP